MVTAVDFEILWRETNDVSNLWRSCRAHEPFVQIIAVVKVGAAGAGGKIAEDGALRELGLGAENSDLAVEYGAQRRLGNVAHEIRRVQSARVDRVDHDSRAIGAIDEVAPVLRVVGDHKSRRNENHHPLAGHSGKTPDDVFEMAVDKIGLRIAAREDSLCLRLRQERRGRQLGCVLVSGKGALDGVLDRRVQRDIVVKIHDAVRLVIDDIGARVNSRPGGQRPGDNVKQRLFEQLAIGGELLPELAGSGVNPDAIGRREGTKQAGRGGADDNGVVHGHVGIVENYGDETLRDGGYGCLRGCFV